MTDTDRIERRLSAVERTLTGEIDIDEQSLQDVLALADEVERIEERQAELENRIATVEADVQSVGGYLSEIDSVNEDVERQALSAVATVEKLEERLDAIEGRVRRLDPDAETLQEEIEQSVVDAETPPTRNDEVPSDGTGEEGDANGDGSWVLDRLRPDDDDGTDGAEQDGADGDGTASSGSGEGNRRVSLKDGNREADRPDEGRRDANETGTVAGRTATQRRVDALFDGDDDEDRDHDRSVIDQLRDRFT